MKNDKLKNFSNDIDAAALELHLPEKDHLKAQKSFSNFVPLRK